MSWPAASSAARSSTRMPLTRSSVSTFSLVRSQSMRGTRKVGVAGEVLAQLRGAGRLEPQIHLLPHGLAPGCRRRRPASAGAAPAASARPRWASQRKRSRSRAKAAAMPGPQDLDRDLLALIGDGEMHLRDRRRRHRRVVEAAIEEFDGLTELGLDHRPRLARRERAADGPAGSTDRSPPLRR